MSKKLVSIFYQLVMTKDDFKEAIDSVLNQNNPNIEVEISDDASTYSKLMQINMSSLY